VLRDMTDAPTGGFHAALDADSEGEEGKYYVWTLDEVRQIVGDSTAADAFAQRYNIRPGGNFEDEATGRPTGTNIPHLGHDTPLPATLSPELAAARERLLAARDLRVPPGKDDKIITAWNGLMIGGLAYAGQVLDEVRYVEAARRAADFCLSTLLLPDGNQLLRRYRDGEAGLPAYLEDYAFLADGLLDLFDATGEARYHESARRLADTLLDRFWDPDEGGFFFTGEGPRNADRALQGPVRRGYPLAQRRGRPRAGPLGPFARRRALPPNGARPAGAFCRRAGTCSPGDANFDRGGRHRVRPG
jgi:uncharacterized protein YyaL (SSP411 family)